MSAPGAERKPEKQNKEKEGVEHTKGEAKSQGKRENPEIKEKRSKILEEKTQRKEGNSEIKHEISERKDASSKEKLENDGKTKDDQTVPLQQDENKARVISQIDETDSQSEIKNERLEGDVLISKER